MFWLVSVCSLNLWTIHQNQHHYGCRRPIVQYVAGLVNVFFISLDFLSSFMLSLLWLLSPPITHYGPQSYLSNCKTKGEDAENGSVELTFPKLSILSKFVLFVVEKSEHENHSFPAHEIDFHPTRSSLWYYFQSWCKELWGCSSRFRWNKKNHFFVMAEVNNQWQYHYAAGVTLHKKCCNFFKTEIIFLVISAIYCLESVTLLVRDIITSLPFVTYCQLS